MQYTVVFDAAQKGYGAWWMPAVGVLFAGAAAASLFLPHHLSRGEKIGRAVLLVLAGLWTVAALIGTLGPHARLARALRQGQCGVVEGEVMQFHAMPFGGHDKESFVVLGKRFEYSDFVVTPGFRNTSSHGGPIRPGLHVRIHHVGNDIARLEIAP